MDTIRLAEAELRSANTRRAGWYSVGAAASGDRFIQRSARTGTPVDGKEYESLVVVTPDLAKSVRIGRFKEMYPNGLSRLG